MRITDRGYSFATIHNEDGNTAHVEGQYRRFQTQAPIRRNQPYELEFYGRGAGLTVGVTAIPRRAAPAVMAAARRRIPSSPRRAAVDRVARTPFGLDPGTPPEAEPGPPTARTFTVGPEFDDPFEHDWIDWDLDPPTLPPPDLPPGGGGGGGGGFPQSAVRIELFMFGTTAPIETWNLPGEDLASRERKVTYSPVGFPSPDAPVWRTTWWRVVVTPTGPDPIEIGVAAYVRIADVPIRTTSLAVRLTNHIFRVALEALVPRAAVDWDTLSVSIGPEIADLVGVAPTIFRDSISPGNRTLNCARSTSPRSQAKS